MKFTKTFLITLLACIFAACSMLFAACNGEGEGAQPTYYTVTAEYNPNEGSIKLSPEADGGKYAKDSKVTVTVTPNTGYKTETFTVDGEDKELTDGAYTLTVTSNTTVAATFTAVPVSSQLPASYNGTYFRLTDNTIITIENGKLNIDQTEYAITAVDNVYHTEWNNIDWIITLHDEDGNTPTLRLTSTLDNGATEINFYRQDISGEILESARGTWVNDLHGITLEIGAKTISWNGEPQTVLTIGTHNGGAYADLYFMHDGKIINLYGLYDNCLHCYMDDDEYTFKNQNTPSGLEIPEILRGKFTGTTSINEEAITLEITKTSITLNGAAATNIEVGQNSNVKFEVGGNKYELVYIEVLKEYDIDINNSSDYGVLTREATSANPEIPLDMRGTYTGSKFNIEYVIILGENSITINGQTVEEYTLGEIYELPGVTFVLDGATYQLYGEDGYYYLDIMGASNISVDMVKDA